jgi:hypothetical protein
VGRWPVETQSGFVGGGVDFTGIWWVGRGLGGERVNPIGEGRGKAP